MKSDQQAAATSEQAISPRTLATRQKILDAATRCYQERGISQTTMEDVASEAGIGRATLYRHFKNRDEVLTQLVLRDLAEIRSLLANGIKQQPTDADYLVEGAIIILRECPKRTIPMLLFGEESSNIINRLSLSEAEMVGFGEELLRPFYEKMQQQGKLRPHLTLPLLVEWVTRLVVSFLTTPSQHLHSDKQLREFLRFALIGPILLPPS